MCNNEQLIGYLYDELDAGERQTVEAHLALCEECRAEVAGLQQTRQHLTTWSPPQPEFTFHIVRSAAPASPAVAPAPRRFGFVPQWAMAAAASLLVLAGAAAIAHVELRYGPEGLVVRTGWASENAGTPQATTPGLVQAVRAGVSSEQSEQLKAVLLALESRLAELERARTSQTVTAARTTPAAITAPELRKIMAASEARQREEMALQVSQVWKDFSAARVNDFTRLQDIVGRAQGVTNQQLRQHRDSIELLSRVSASQR